MPKDCSRAPCHWTSFLSFPIQAKPQCRRLGELERLRSGISKFCSDSGLMLKKKGAYCSRPGLSLWQVPPISLLYLPHIFLSPFYRPGLSLWQVPPISFSLSLVGPACHCGRSRLSPSSIFSTFLPLSLSYRPGLSLWQVPPFLSPSFPSSPSSPFPFPLFYRPGLSLWQVPPIFDFTSLI